jgi:hypothetical protein
VLVPNKPVRVIVKYAVVPCTKDNEAPESTTLPVRFELISDAAASNP